MPLESVSSMSSCSDNESAFDDFATVECDIPGTLIEQLCAIAEGESCGMTHREFGLILAAVGKKCNHGLPQEILPTPTQREEFYRALRLQDLALAQACALGREKAWERFLSLYRSAITQAAIAITKSSTLGHDLADSLYSELFGLKEKDQRRISPLASYSGRGSLLGWLRTTLAQRHVDHHRRTHRETPLDTLDVPASPSLSSVAADELELLRTAVSRTLEALDPPDQFLLSSYFLDRRTLLQISQLLNIHEATVSRRLKRLVADVRAQLIENLQSVGLNKRHAEELLGADPRDIEINLRSLLQTSQTATFTDRTKQTGVDSR